MGWAEKCPSKSFAIVAKVTWPSWSISIASARRVTSDIDDFTVCSTRLPSAGSARSIAKINEVSDFADPGRCCYPTGAADVVR